jgi:hypothetical protein
MISIGARKRRNQNSRDLAEGMAGENLGRSMRWFVDPQAARRVRNKLSGQLVSAGRLQKKTEVYLCKSVGIQIFVNNKRSEHKREIYQEAAFANG